MVLTIKGMTKYQADYYRDDFYGDSRKQGHKTMRNSQRHCCPDKNIGKNPDPAGNNPANGEIRFCAYA